MSDLDYDETGKVVLDEIYNEVTPVPYYTQLSQLDYCIPEIAKPEFERVLEARRQGVSDRGLKVLDLGCSYGVNAALLNYRQSLQQLTAHYQEAGELGLEPEEMIARDREVFSEHADETVSIVGLDTSENALKYAVSAGMIDSGLSADLEEEEPNALQSRMIGGSDVIISTGCYGYVTEKTLNRLVAAGHERKPWMAHFVLRTMDFEPAAESLAERGYVSRRAGQPVRQRRFASKEEQSRVLDSLQERGIDPEGMEADGWYYAQLHLSCPADEANTLFSGWDTQEVRA